MNKLTFYYGVMGCSKTANALMTRFNYMEKNRNVWLIKPSIDNRDDRIINGKSVAILKSRIGIESPAEIIRPDEDIIVPEGVDVIICDEAQFLSEKQVDELRSLSVDVICYGLRTDFLTNLFPGSKRLFELADNIIELKSICDCGNPALVNMRIDDSGNIIVDGDQVAIGGNDRYKAVCWHCYQKNIRFHNKLI